MNDNYDAEIIVKFKAKNLIDYEALMEFYGETEQEKFETWIMYLVEEEGLLGFTEDNPEVLEIKMIKN